MKKKYRMTGSCPIIVKGYGRVEPNEPPTVFVCSMDLGQEEFFIKIGAIEVVAIASEETPTTEPLQPSTPAWPGERVLNSYDKK